jgi:hypothetical protein
MNLTLIALVVALLGLAPIASLDQMAVPETMWLAMWGVALLSGAAGVRMLSPIAVDARLLKKQHDYVVKAA